MRVNFISMERNRRMLDAAPALASLTMSCGIMPCHVM